MPDKPDRPPNLPPKTKVLIEEADKETTDRVKQISSLSDTMNRMNKDAQDATKKITSQVSSIAVKQKETDDILKEIKEAPGEEIESVVPAVNRVLDKLGMTMQRLATGMKNITVSTARATKESVSQYGKAISEDISVNRQNVIAMSLARATPLFGYFAAKFMETDVFKNATKRLKERISTTISTVATTVGSKVRELFSRKPKGVVGTAEEVEEKAPKLQRGGYVERGGVAEVHPAEVVVPIDDLLERIDKRVEIRKTQSLLLHSITSLSRHMARTETYVGEMEKKRRSIIGDFIRGFQRATNKIQMSWQDRMLKATLDLKVGLLGMSSRLRLAWQRTLVMHPVFRTLIMFTQRLGRTFTFPFRFFFAARGKYISAVRAATRAPNAFEKIVGLLSIIYSEGMFKLDQLNYYMKQLLEFQTGKAEELEKPTWRVARKMLRGAAVPFELAVQKLGDRQIIFSKKQAEMLTRERKGIMGLFRKKKEIVAPGRVAIDIVADNTTKMLETLSFFRSFFPGVERKSLEMSKEQALEMKKTRKGVYEVSKEMGGLRKRLKGVGTSIWKYLLIGISVIRSLFGRFTKLISPLASLLKVGIGGLVKLIIPFLGPILAVLAAGAFGYAIGRLINKYLISPILKKWWKALDERTKKSTEASMKILEEHAAKVRRGVPGKERVESREALKMRTGLSAKADEMRKKYGLGPWSTKYQIIQAEQQKYMDEHLGEYLKYGHEQVNAIRTKWNERFLAFRGIRTFESPEKYGVRREEAFLKYLKKEGKILTPAEIARMSTYGGTTEETRKTTAVRTGEYLKREAEVKMAEGKMIAAKVGEKVLEAAVVGKETAEKGTALLVNTFNNSVNSSNANVINTPQVGSPTGGFSEGDQYTRGLASAQLS